MTSGTPTGVLPVWAPALAAAATGAAVVALVAGIAGTNGLLYGGLYVLATVPGLPVGFMLFGRRQVAGAVSGVLLGYALTSLALWTAIRFGYHTQMACAGVWTALTASTWIACWPRSRAPLVELPAWRRSDTLALALVLLLVPAICSAPFLNVGHRDPDGARAYRAYFTMDFFWHTALTAEVSKFHVPPRNPYWASEPLHYYWTYFVVPATVIGNAPARLGLEIQQVLLINALLTGVLLIAMVFLLAWVVVPRAGPVAIAVSLALLASSAEGSYVVVDLLRRGRSLTLVREYNIDAIAAWAFNGLRIDGLQRSLWWVPQHAMACSLGLVALVVSAASGVRASLGTLALAGCALGLSVTMSPFLGASFSLVFGVATLFHALRAPRRLPADLARCSIAAVPVVAAIGWSVSTGVLEGTSGAMRMGLGGLAAHSPVVALLLSLGPALFLAAPGIWPAVRAQRPALTSLAGLLVGLAIYYLLWIPLDEAYIGFRAGQIILMTVPGLAAFAVAGLSDIAGRWAASLVIGLVFVVGLPTAAIDWYNAQDITYREMGPGFRWTQTITPEEADAFRWIRRATEPDATVQMEPIVRDRDTWTMIPTFAERRMAAGMAYSLLRVPEFEQRSLRARSMYETPNAADAWAAARELGVDYVYIDRTERAAFPPAAIEKFNTHPQYFRRVFDNGEVDIYRVLAPLD